MKKTRVTDIVELSKIFKIDPTSSSNLSWNTEIFGGRGMKVKRCWVGKHCDTKHIRHNRYMVKYGGHDYFVSRLIYCLANAKNYSDKSFIVDHINGNSLDNRLGNLRAVSPVVNSRNKTKHINSSSGITGVSLARRDDRQYWRASWQSLDGVQKSKYFSIKKFGFEQAKQLAIEYRRVMIVELNDAGAGYTARHGT